MVEGELHAPNTTELSGCFERLMDCFGHYTAVRDAGGAIVDFRVAYVNPAACENNLMTAEEQVGGLLLELLPGHMQSRLFAAYVGVVERNEVFEVQALPYLDTYGGDAEQRWFDIRAWKLGDGFAAVWRDVTRQERLRRRLAEGGPAAVPQANHPDLLEAILDRIPVLLCIWDPALRRFRFNAHFRRVLGWTEADADADFMAKVYPDPAYRAQVEQYMRSLHPGFRDLRTTTRDGTQLDISWANIRLADDTLVGIGVEVGERVSAQDALRRSERFFRQLAETNLVGVGYGDDQGRVAYVNDEMLRMMGRARADFDAGAIDWVQCVAPEFRAELPASAAALQSRGHTGSYQRAFLRPDGQRTPYLGAAALVAPDEPWHVSIALDLTNLHAAQQQFRDTQRRLRLAIDAAAIVAFEWDAATDTIARIAPADPLAFGVDVRTLGDTAADYFSRVHPDDRDTLHDALARLSPQAPGLCVEYRLQKPDGAPLWVRDQGVGEFNPDGKLAKLRGIALNITDARCVEEQLRESERRFRVMADELPLIVWLHDAQGRQEFVNQTLCDFFGVSRAEMTGERWQALIHPEDYPVYVEAFAESVRQRRDFHALARVRRADGQWRWIESWGRARFDGQGRFLGHLGSSADVTDRKAAERALLEANTDLERRVAERTAELRRRADQLGRLSTELALTEQRERRRLAQVLHDHLQQLLVAAKLNLHRLTDRGADEDRAVVRSVQDVLDEAVAASRSLTVELAPPVLQEAGLVAALHWLGQHITQRHGLPVTVHADADLRLTREDLRLVIFQAVRELLFNAVKHAQATAATIRVPPPRDGQLQLTICDDGRGFNPDQPPSTTVTGGFGLFSIRERLALLGGHLAATSTPGAGACFTLTVPLSPPAH